MNEKNTAGRSPVLQTVIAAAVLAAALVLRELVALPAGLPARAWRTGISLVVLIAALALRLEKSEKPAAKRV